MTVKVLQIISGFGGGISSFVWNKVKSVDQEKVVFDILTYDDCSIEFEKDVHNMGGKIFKMPNPKEKGWKAFYKKVNDVMSPENEYAMVHCHISGYRSLPFRLLAQKNRIHRFIIHAHTSSNPLIPEKVIEKTNRKLNAMIASEKVSCGIKSSNYTFGTKYVQEKKIMHIPNSIDEKLYFREIDEHFKAEILGENKLPETIIIGHVGRFHEVKNHDFMIQIMQELKQQNIDFLWLFIGNGDLQDAVKIKVKNSNLNDNAKFLGRREDVHKFYKLMDVFVLPSFYEGFPTVAVEAQAAGTPTILSDSITREADLGMNLVDFCSINKDPSIWVNKIIEAKTKKIPSVEERKHEIKNKKFSNSASADLYEEFVLEKIFHYEI